MLYCIRSYSVRDFLRYRRILLVLPRTPPLLPPSPVLRVPPTPFPPFSVHCNSDLQQSQVSETSFPKQLE